MPSLSSSQPATTTSSAAPELGAFVDAWGPISHPVVKRLVPFRVPLLVAAHAVFFLLTYWLAFSLRFDFEIPDQHWSTFQNSLLLMLAVKLLVFYQVGHFHGWLTHVTFSDVVAIARASVISTALLALSNLMFAGFSIPRGVLVIDLLVTITIFSMFRSILRLFGESIHPAFGRNRQRLKRCLMIGADRDSGVLAHHIHSSPISPYRIMGFLATEPGGPVRRMGHLRVRGTLLDLAAVAEKCQISEVLISLGTLAGDRLRDLKTECDQLGLSLKIIPHASDLFRGGKEIPIRDIDITDLLRRETVQLDDTAIGELIRNRRVLVTGAGGSIGSEICRQVMKFGPSELVLLGRGENRIFVIENELRRRYPQAKFIPIITDISDPGTMREVFEKQRPEIVFHAAAHKHVPLMEANVAEAVKNNVGGTRCVADLADEYDTKAFVLISTDKAVNPTSIMGTTKHLAERYVNALSSESSTKFMVVRFGNVLGSAGSVVPIFENQIRAGGPITITDPRMRRYFMTIPEASRLVLQAAAMGKGGEIFVLDMGEPVKIVDLARDMIRLAGLPENAIEIEFSGVRPGEKLYEELYFSDEASLPTSHEKVRAAKHRPFPFEQVRKSIDQLIASRSQPSEQLRQQLRELVPEFHTPGDSGLGEGPKTAAAVGKSVRDARDNLPPQKTRTLPAQA